MSARPTRLGDSPHFDGVIAEIEAERRAGLYHSYAEWVPVVADFRFPFDVREMDYHAVQVAVRDFLCMTFCMQQGIAMALRERRKGLRVIEGGEHAV